MLKKIENIKLKSNLLKDATDLFTYIDSDFVNVKETPKETNEVTVIELEKNGTFKQIYASMGKVEYLWMSQESVLQYLRENELDKEYDYFFLLKSDTNFFVACVDFDAYGRLRLFVRRLSDDRGWRASYQHRFVTPKLEEKKKHIPTYDVWRKMKDRCVNEENSNYHNYGGRGIVYCDKWEEYESFIYDMGEKPEGLSLDRINNNGNYCKENCRWATPKEQASNRRDSVIFNGETAKDASLRLGGGHNLVNQRIKSCGWSIEDAFTIPLNSFESLESRITKLEKNI